MNDQPINNDKYPFDNPRNVKKIVYILCTCCVVLLGLDLFTYRHSVHPWEKVFGFYALYGFIACVFLVLIAKEMRKVLMRRDNYYDD